MPPWSTIASSGGDDGPKAKPIPTSSTSTSTSTSTRSSTTKPPEPTTKTSTAGVALDADDQGLVDANPDVFDADTCQAMDRPDYAIAGIMCAPAAGVLTEGTTGAPPSAIGLFDAGTSDIKAIADAEYAAGNTSELFTQIIDGEPVYAYFDTFDDNTVAYIIYSEANGTITWWLTDSADQEAFADHRPASATKGVVAPDSTFLAGSAFVWLVCLVLPQREPRARDAPPAGPGMGYGLRLGAAGAAAAAIGFALDFDHVGWACAAALMVMRPTRDVQISRMFRRVASVITAAHWPCC